MRSAEFHEILSNRPVPKFYCIVQGAHGRVTVNLEPPTTVGNAGEGKTSSDSESTGAENNSSPTPVMKSKWIKALKHTKEERSECRYIR